MSDASPVATWKPIPGWEGLYEAGDHGEVRSVDRDVRYSNGSVVRHRGRVLKHKLRPVTGHHDVLLQGNGVKRSVGVHRAVLLAFEPDPPADHFPCHKNGDPHDNRLSNLYWGTASQNMHDKKKHGTDHQLNKTHCPRGHAYTGPNLISSLGNRDAMGNPAPQRNCRACIRTCKVFDLLRKQGLPLPDFDEMSHQKYAEILAHRPGDCKYGHQMVGPNLSINNRKRGVERVCRACHRARGRIADAKRAGRGIPDFQLLSDEMYQQIMEDYEPPAIPAQRAESPMIPGLVLADEES